MWSMRERKKSSVAGQANITAELPEISRYWISNWEFSPSAITPERQRLSGLWGLFRGDEFLIRRNPRTFESMTALRRVSKISA
jgi:hypothetical protein